MNPMSRRRALVLGGGAALAGGIAIGASGLAGADTETRASWRKIGVVTANIGRKHPSKREAAIRAVRDGVSIDGKRVRPFVGWQEIREGDADAREPGWIDHYFGTAYTNVFNGKSPAHMVPLSVPKEFDVVDKRTTYCHGGLAHVSPARYITEALVAAKDDPKLRFVFANTHYVAGAFNGKTDGHEKWRDDAWHKHFVKHRDKVLKYWRDRGFPVIWTGDVNRQSMPLLMPKFEKRAFGKGIDQIGWVPGGNGVEIRLVSTHAIDMAVDDHNARVAVLKIRRG